MRWRHGWIGLVAATVAGALVPQDAWGACGSWQKVGSAPGVHGSFADVSASSATDAWAVGSSGPDTLAEHWNGSGWRRVATPNPGRFSVLGAVVSIASDDAWAVGAFAGRASPPLVLHWNGRAWRRQAVPSNARHAAFFDVAADSANDVWVVGESAHGLARTMHYDGSTWRVVHAVSLNSQNDLDAVVAITPNDAWTATGRVVEHWDGHVWRPHRLPAALGGVIDLAANAPTDVWAAGNTGLRGTVDHWNGHSWTTVTHTVNDSDLLAVATSGPTDVWTVGDDLVNGGSLRVHWDGAVRVQQGVPPQGPAVLTALALVPASTTFWAVGFTRHERFPTGSFFTPLTQSLC